MRSNVSADIVCVFEHAGTSVDAQRFITARIRNVAGADRVGFNSIRIIRWCNPETNEPRQFMHSDGKQYFRYSAQFSVGFTIEGGYAEAQQWIVDRLNEDESTSYMNVQSVTMSVAPLAV